MKKRKGSCRIDALEAISGGGKKAAYVGEHAFLAVTAFAGSGLHSHADAAAGHGSPVHSDALAVLLLPDGPEELAQLPFHFFMNEKIFGDLPRFAGLFLQDKFYNCFGAGRNLFRTVMAGAFHALYAADVIAVRQGLVAVGIVLDLRIPVEFSGLVIKGCGLGFVFTFRFLHFKFLRFLSFTKGEIFALHYMHRKRAFCGGVFRNVF